MHWYFIKSGPKPRAPLTCPGSAASSLHAPFPTWKTPPSPPSQALPLLTDSTKLNCTKHTSENLINIVWKYNWGLTGAWIFHFEAKISALIYEKDLVLQIAMTVEINVNPSYAFPLNLQSLSRQCCVSPGHTSPGRAAETPRYSQPLLFPGSAPAAKGIRSIQHIWGAKSCGRFELHIETEPWLTLGSGFVSTWLLTRQLMAWSWIFKSKVLPKVVLQHQNSSPTAVILLSVPTEESVPICTQ